MRHKSGTRPESAQTQKSADNQSGGKPSDFVVGLVTFILSILFMTAWMYFST